ncbi:hypothetical protein BSKO_05711 [Bryopsis sp. KO-2023]|nr:hypothetical protein BSKO_05711 [Bryopsis sp. KO-2023]
MDTDSFCWWFYSRIHRKLRAVDGGGEEADFNEGLKRDLLKFGGMERLLQQTPLRQDLYDDVKAKLVEAAGGLTKGDPKDPEVFIGPLIAESEAIRIEKWVKEAADMGATVLCGRCSV